MKIRFRDQDFSHERQARIVEINSILNQYKSAVSVRQVYYRLVAAGKIPNTQREYDKVQGLITDARYAGLIDWNAIEDRNRAPYRKRFWENGRDALDEAVRKYSQDRWLTQPYYIELWVEKAALAGVLSPIANDYHIALMVNRGYSSASAMMDSAMRISHYANGDPKKDIQPRKPVILYVGDHDPSGEDMVRDIRDRLLEFQCSPYLLVNKVALTMAQIEEHNPPPNPVKLSDARAGQYIASHGASSWEVDALPPPTLDLITRTTINAFVDKGAMTKAIQREVQVKQALEKFAKSFSEPK